MRNVDTTKKGVESARSFIVLGFLPFFCDLEVGSDFWVGEEGWGPGPVSMEVSTLGSRVSGDPPEAKSCCGFGGRRGTQFVVSGSLGDLFRTQRPCVEGSWFDLRRDAGDRDVSTRPLGRRPRVRTPEPTREGSFRSPVTVREAFRDGGLFVLQSWFPIPSLGKVTTG